MIDNKAMSKEEVIPAIIVGIGTFFVGIVVVLFIAYHILVFLGVAMLSIAVDGGLPVYPMDTVSMKYTKQIEQKYKNDALYLVEYKIPTVGEVTSIDLSQSTITSTEEIVVQKEGQGVDGNIFDMSKYHATGYDRYFVLIKGHIQYCINSSEDNCDTREGEILLYQSAK